MTLANSGEIGDPCGVPSAERRKALIADDPGLQIAPQQPQHSLVIDPSGDPRHQRVVLDAIKERLQIDIDNPRRVILHELACPQDGLMGRAPGPKPEAVIAEMRLKDGLEHLQHGLLDQPVQHRRHPQRPLPTPGFGDHHPAHRPRLIGARVKRRPHTRPVLLEPWPKLRGRHRVDASGTGVALDTSKRRHEVLAGENPLPQTRGGGVSGGRVRRRAVAAL
jgi:hypothetical protein